MTPLRNARVSYAGLLTGAGVRALLHEARVLATMPPGTLESMRYDLRRLAAQDIEPNILRGYPFNPLTLTPRKPKL